MNKLIFFVAMLLFCNFTFAQKHKHGMAVETADTTNFNVNYQSGWQIYNSYVAPINADSVVIEIILQHDRAIDWKQEQLIGHIKLTPVNPKISQTTSFMLMFDEYKLRVEPNGRCYLWLAKGAIPDGDPLIIPVKVAYKR